MKALTGMLVVILATGWASAARRARHHLRRRGQRRQSVRDAARHARLSLHRSVPDDRHPRRRAREQCIRRLPGPRGVRARHHGDASRWRPVRPLRVRRRGSSRPARRGLVQRAAGEPGRPPDRRGHAERHLRPGQSSRVRPLLGAERLARPPGGDLHRPPVRGRARGHSGWTTSASARAPPRCPSPRPWRWP